MRAQSPSTPEKGHPGKEEGGRGMGVRPKHSDMGVSKKGQPDVGVRA